MKARTKTLREELLAHTETDLAHHAETKAAITDVRKRVDKLTEVVLEGFQNREEISVAKRKATIGDKADSRRMLRAIAKKLILVAIAVAGAFIGAAIHGCTR